MRIRLTAFAVQDLEDATTYYDEAAGLGTTFLDQFELALRRLELFPRSAPPVAGFPEVRRARVRRFPFGLFYRVEQEQLIVLRVLHARRDAASQLDQPDTRT